MSDDLLGGRYRVGREIGSGGCGQTFLVEDTHLPSKRLCVVKKLRPYTTDSATRRIIRERSEREAIVLEELGLLSTEIPDLYDYFNEDGEFYLVQEWVDGENLGVAVGRAGLLIDDREPVGDARFMCEDDGLARIGRMALRMQRQTRAGRRAPVALEK